MRADCSSAERPLWAPTRQEKAAQNTRSAVSANDGDNTESPRPEPPARGGLTSCGTQVGGPDAVLRSASPQAARADSSYSLRGFEGLWLRSLPAARFADLLADFDPSVLAAEEAAVLLVTRVDLVCERALPAALFAAVMDFDPSVFDVDAAARLPVRSLVAAIRLSFLVGLARSAAARGARTLDSINSAGRRTGATPGGRGSRATRRPSSNTATSSNLAPTASTKRRTVGTDGLPDRSISDTVG